MSGGGFSLSGKSKALLIAFIVLLGIGSFSCFNRAFPFNDAFISSIFFSLGLIVGIICLILLIVLLISK